MKKVLVGTGEVSKKQSLSHDSAKGHVTGESEFIDDRPFIQGEVHVGVFYSPLAHAHLKKIDLSEAQKVPGIVGLFTADDIAHNEWGPISQDQPLLAKDKIQYAGEPLVVIAGTDLKSVSLAKKLIKLDLEELPPVLTLDSAIQQQLFLDGPHVIATGDVDKAFAEAPHVLEGVFQNGGQEHFYLESQAAIAYPGEYDTLEVFSSSQHPTEVQHVVAHGLGLPYHKVVCVVKRMGGGFGGKESQASHMAFLAALVAHKLKRPARLVLNKDDDMKITGKRHPFKNFYKVAFDQEGKILGLKVDLYADGGAYVDLSPAILQRAMLHIDNAYYLPNAHLTGRVCKTHLAPNTAFRGFGGPQGVATIENIMEEIALVLKKDAFQVRRINCYGEAPRAFTPYGQEVTQNMLPRLFDQLYQSSRYEERRKDIEEFNKTSKVLLKGISLTAVKFGISFTSRFLNQGNSLINVQTDGSVQVSTGATEMGQGVNAKILQIVSEIFGLPAEHVRIMPTSTEKNHNTSATAASSGSDLNGWAAALAAQKIKDRLANLAFQYFQKGEISATDEYQIEPSLMEEAQKKIVFAEGMVFHRDFPQDPQKRIKFSDLTKKAFFNRISLGDYAFYKTPGIHFDKAKGKGHPFLYFTNGVAVSEVSIDRFTGDLKILRTDILMDLGRPINESIDQGQIAGAFVQGSGWVTTEELFYSPKGELLSHSPTTYKIPNIQDTPRVFHIDLIENHQNTMNIRGSKAVGEPPFLLGLSVWTAVKHALGWVANAGGDSDLAGNLPRFKIPATSEEILNTLRKIQKKGVSSAPLS